MLLAVFCLSVGIAAGQNVKDKVTERKNPADSIVVPEGFELADSVVYIPNDLLDKELAGKDIFVLLNDKSYGMYGSTSVSQSSEILESFRKYLDANKSRAMPGYRVRIFFDNKRTAREESERVLSSFRMLHYDISAYRSYVNPYFKVTVGDFRTKSEAMSFLKEIREEFPSAFIVRENINYPVLDHERPVIADTVQILRPISVK